MRTPDHYANRRNENLLPTKDVLWWVTGILAVTIIVTLYIAAKG